MDLDDKGVDRSGNPDFLTDRRTFACWARSLTTPCWPNVKKTDAGASPRMGFKLATARSHRF
jgi:hypothetical protein